MGSVDCGCSGGKIPMTRRLSRPTGEGDGNGAIEKTMIERNPIDVARIAKTKARFEAKYQERDPDACWYWTAGTFGDGYGRFTFAGKYHQAHRIAWAVAYGEDPGDNLVLHHCDQVNCVNPNHLYLGDQTDNMRDAEVRGGPDVFSSLGEENPNAKLTADDVEEIRIRYEKEDVVQRDLASEYGVSSSLISMVVNEVQWPHV